MLTDESLTSGRQSAPNLNFESQLFTTLKTLPDVAVIGIVKRSGFNFDPKYPVAILGDEIRFTIDVEADYRVRNAHART